MRVHGSSDGSFLENVYRRAFQASWAISPSRGSRILGFGV